jgi:hypothetical protein
MGSAVWLSDYYPERIVAGGLHVDRSERTENSSVEDSD